MEATKQNLQDLVNIGIETETQIFAVVVLNEMNNQEELIINTMENMANGKLDYYCNAYDDNLRLKTNSKIRLVRFIITNILDEVKTIY